MPLALSVFTQFRLGNAATFGIEFALDGAEAILAPDLGDDVNANIRSRNTLQFCPVGEEPRTLILLLHAAIVVDEGNRKPLEIIAFLPLCAGGLAELSEKLTKRR